MEKRVARSEGRVAGGERSNETLRAQPRIDPRRKPLVRSSPVHISRFELTADRNANGVGNLIGVNSRDFVGLSPEQLRFERMCLPKAAVLRTL